jgi:methylamine--corrinoid protein Co-methyltransferase
MLTILDIYDRTLTGRPVSEMDFDTKILPHKVQELIKKYDLKYDPAKPVPTDESLAKNAYKAGLELLTEIGVLCIDTSRIIPIAEAEVKEVLRAKSNEIVVGEGVDAVKIVGRKPGDKVPPHICGGPCGGPLSTEIYSEVLQSYAQEPLVKSIHTGSMYEVGGREIRAGTPSELLAARCEGIWARETISKANRPGTSIMGVMSAVTLAAIEVADLPGGLRPTDMHLISFLNELKTDWRLLSKVVYNLQVGNIISSCQAPIMGGIAGGPEGTAIVTIATTLQGFVMGGIMHSIAPFNWHAVNSDRTGIWMASLHNLALRTAGVNLPTFVYMNPWAGPCTEMITYEIPALVIACTASGTSGIFSAAPRGGNVKDHFTGMESRIAAETAHAAAGMKIETANEIVDILLKKYEVAHKEKKVPSGKTFQECYDVKALTPCKEYLEFWAKTKKELEDLGLTFPF